MRGIEDIFYTLTVIAFFKLGYDVSDDGKTATYAKGSVANGFTATVTANDKVIGFDDETYYYRRHYHRWSEIGSQYDHDIKGADYFSPIVELKAQNDDD